MHKLERQIAIWNRLSRSSGGETLRDLATSFGVAKNTIQRDVDALGTAGLAIQEVQEGQTLRFLAPGSTGIPKQLSLVEQTALAAAGAALQPYRETPLGSAFQRALSGTGAGGVEPVLITSGARGPPVDPAILETLIRGILARRRCRLAYRSRAGVARTHEVGPHHLFLHGGLLYLRAQGAARPGLITFLVHSISSVALLAETFVPRRFRPTGFGVYEEKPQKVEVRFAAAVAPIITERVWHPSQALRSQPDGGLLFFATLGGRAEFISWVLSWGSAAELVRPAGWRADLLEHLAALRQIYGGG